MMKKLLLATSLAAVIAIPASAIAAADGTITFTGEITNTTCAISVNGSASANTAVTFDPVSATSLTTNGAVGAEKPITMSLTDCQNPTENVRAVFDSAHTDPTTGNLANTGTAGNVQVQLLDSTRSAINLNNPQSSGPSFNIVDGKASLHYYARYFATDQVTGGDVNTLVNYSLSYF
ncbi:fimbrial protein [Erwinia sorbitola]|uniref:Fimbrial protein n=1 Tax=Erwinia sorbitola TaxID=2681984 RepID=A0A6I6EAK5_9GAMM|nr:fimbrial protein [Erwinia sorbitola]MTD28727.1 fimbrial protein [Erwinia sorbitola]QGU86824.1 fimbrial protein [Erwinia sorbitola]